MKKEERKVSKEGGRQEHVKGRVKEQGGRGRRRTSKGGTESMRGIKVFNFFSVHTHVSSNFLIFPPSFLSK